MKIRMLSTMAGPAGVRQAGSVFEAEDEMGQQLVDGGFAVVVEAPEAATATVEAPEAATAPPQRRNPIRRGRGR